MDIRKHIGARAAEQYVKTAPPRVELELVQYLEHMYPGRIVDYDVPCMTHAGLAFVAGQQSIIHELRRLGTLSEEKRALAIKSALEERSNNV